MASTTPNIGLTLPTGAEKVSRQIINDNNTIIDGKMGAVPGGQNLQGEIDALNGKINYVGIEGQYSTVLAAINAFRNIKSYPISIQKAGNSAYTDLPAGVTNTCEWNVICYGSNTRITAELSIYTGGGNDNNRTYTALIYDGSYINNWRSLSLSDELFVDSDGTTETQNFNLSNGHFATPVFLLSLGYDTRGMSAVIYINAMNENKVAFSTISRIGSLNISSISFSPSTKVLTVVFDNNPFRKARLITLAR